MQIRIVIILVLDTMLWCKYKWNKQCLLVGMFGSNTTANFVTGIGVEALYSNTTGGGNNALGYQA